MEIKFYDHLGRERRCSPARDIAWFWPQIIAVAGSCLTRERWDDAIEQIVKSSGITEDQIWRAYVDFIRFCERTLDPGLSNPKEVLEAVGFFNHHPAARAVVLYRVGVTGSGAFFAGIKSSTPENQTPVEIQQLAKMGQELCEVLLKKDQENRN